MGFACIVCVSMFVMRVDERMRGAMRETRHRDRVFDCAFAPFCASLRTKKRQPSESIK